MSHQSLGRWRERPDHLVGDAGEMASEDSDACFDNLGASRDLGEDVCSALSMVRCSAEPSSRGLSFLQSHRLLHPPWTGDGPSIIFGCER